MLSWRSIFKSWAGVPVLILVALAVVWVFTNGLPVYKNWQAKRAYEKLSEPYYSDIYGGKTPEETYDMFIDALKKGDVELASKYFVVEKQGDWLKTLTEYERESVIKSFIEELENTKKIWKKVESNKYPDLVSFEYLVEVKNDSTVDLEGQQINVPKGNYANEAMFQKYPSGVWKIEGL